MNFCRSLAEVAADSGAEAVRIEAVPVGEKSTGSAVIDEGDDGLLLVDLPSSPLPLWMPPIRAKFSVAEPARPKLDSPECPQSWLGADDG